MLVAFLCCEKKTKFSSIPNSNKFHHWSKVASLINKWTNSRCSNAQYKRINKHDTGRLTHQGPKKAKNIVGEIQKRKVLKLLPICHMLFGQSKFQGRGNSRYLIYRCKKFTSMNTNKTHDRFTPFFIICFHLTPKRHPGYRF